MGDWQRSMRTRSRMPTMSDCTIRKSPERTDNIVHCFLLPLQQPEQSTTMLAVLPILTFKHTVSRVLVNMSY